MIYSITSSIDATMYEQFKTVNSGLDEVLQLDKVISESTTNKTYNSRILTKFNLTHISKSIGSGDIDPKFVSTLKLYTHTAEMLPYSYNVEVYAVSESWNMGIGRAEHNPKTTEGVSWQFRQGYNTGEWLTSSFATGTDGSINTQTTNGGGTWWTGSTNTSQGFEYETSDLVVNVTDIANAWLSGSWNGGPVLTNEGFIIKRSNEYDGNNYGNINFFSKETHTVYEPKLQFAWNDYSAVTASLTAVDLSDDVFVYMKNQPDLIHKDSRERFRIAGRSRYPSKTYATASEALATTFLPTNSYWAVEDYKTGETLIDFDDTYTKISCDSAGNYFDLWMDQFQVNRRYKFKIKSISGKTRKIFDNDLTFKVVD